MTKDKDRYKSTMYNGAEWSCRYFDGEWCELIGVPKRVLTSCKGVYHSCQKQLIRHNRDSRG